MKSTKKNMHPDRKEAIEYLESKDGTCGWDDMTAEMSDKMLDACIAGLVKSCDETETWTLL